MHPKLTTRILCLLIMHLSLGHVTLLPGEFQPLNFSPNLTYGAGWPHVGLCPIFLVSVNFSFFYMHILLLFEFQKNIIVLHCVTLCYSRSFFYNCNNTHVILFFLPVMSVTDKCFVFSQLLLQQLYFTTVMDCSVRL